MKPAESYAIERHVPRLRTRTIRFIRRQREWARPAVIVAVLVAIAIGVPLILHVIATWGV